MLCIGLQANVQSRELQPLGAPATIVKSNVTNHDIGDFFLASRTGVTKVSDTIPSLGLILNV